MEARSQEENIGEKPKRAKSDAKQVKVVAQGHQGGKGVGGKGRGGAGQEDGKCGQTWAQSVLCFSLQTKQDKINLLRIMVAGEAHDGVLADVGKTVQVKVPDLQELGKLLTVLK
jgi:hypothetical protein